MLQKAWVDYLLSAHQNAGVGLVVVGGVHAVLYILSAHQNAGVGLVVVGGVHAVEPLLACCVPEVCEHDKNGKTVDSTIMI